MNFQKIKKILVVRMRHLGDVLLTSPVFTQLKKTMPHAEIDAFINQESLPMLSGHPAISDYFLYDRAWKSLPFYPRIKKELALLQAVRAKKYDLVLNLTEGDRGAIIARYSGAPYRVGFDPGKSGFFGKRKLYTHLAKICPHPRHTVERQLDVLRCLGIHPEWEERDLFFDVPLDSLHKMRSLCGEDFILIHPVSRWMFKSPPISFFKALIQELLDRGERVVVTGGAEEASYVDEIVAGFSSVINLGGKTSLKELGALIQLSKTLVTVDSVPLHLASALKAPVVAIFGPSSEINWGPWRNPKGHVITPKVSCRPCYMAGCGGSRKSDCLSRISVEEVLFHIPVTPNASHLHLSN